MGFLSKTNPRATAKSLLISSFICACLFTLYAWWVNQNPKMQFKMPLWFFAAGGAFCGWIIEWQKESAACPSPRTRKKGQGDDSAPDA